MCGRFAFFAEKEELEEIYPGITFDFWPAKRYNIAPGQDVLTIIHAGGLATRALRWGLVPSWSKDPSIGNKMINARVETIAEKPSFKKPLLRQRCIIPASGFFEWKKTEKNKIPHFLRFRSGKLMLFAGLFDMWQKPDGSTLLSGTIITRPALQQYHDIHDRMPAILRPQASLEWINEKEKDIDILKNILEEIDDSEIEARPVSFIVNNPSNDVPKCIQPT